MAVTPAVKGVLVVALLAFLSALAVATTMGRLSSRREMVAPEAWAALEQQEPARAAAIFARELKQHPADPVLHFGAGAAAYALGRPGPALASLRKAIELDPEFPEALVLLGKVAYERGNTSLAVESMEKALALRPRDKDAAELLERWRRESSVHRSYLEKPAAHFRILYEGGTQQSIGDRVVRVLEREYQRIGRILNSVPAEPVTVVLYTDREFHDITRSPAWATGHYDGRIRIAVGGAMAPDDLDRVLTHELVHAVVNSAARKRVPAWLDEGLATHLEGTDRGWIAHAVRNAETIVPLEALARGFGSLDEHGALTAYAESAIAAEILCTRLGPNIGAFLELVGDGSSVDRALLEFQVEPEAFHAEWRRRVGRR